MLVLPSLVDVSRFNTFKVLFSFLKSVAHANEHSSTIKNRVSTAAKVDGVTMFLFVQLDSNLSGQVSFYGDRSEYCAHEEATERSLGYGVRGSKECLGGKVRS